MDLEFSIEAVQWSFLCCFAQIGWRVGKRRTLVQHGRENKLFKKYVSPNLKYE